MMTAEYSLTVGPCECDGTGYTPIKSPLTSCSGRFPGVLQLPGPLFPGCVSQLQPPSAGAACLGRPESRERKRCPWALEGLGQLQLSPRQEADRAQCLDWHPGATPLPLPCAHSGGPCPPSGLTLGVRCPLLGLAQPVAVSVTGPPGDSDRPLPFL